MATIRKREGTKGVSWQIDYFDPAGKRVRQSFKKKKDAEAELGKRVSLIAEKRYLDVKKDYNTTLKELLDKYTENHQNQACFKSAKRSDLESIRTYFGENTRLSNIRYVHLETYRNHLRKKPTWWGGVRTNGTVNRQMSCLHHVFSKAVEWEMVERSPFDRGKPLWLKENNKRLRFLSEDEIKKLLAGCPTYLRRIVECAINTGMRRGEILSLKWSQIRNGLIYLDKTKTNESRQIPINDDLARVFQEIRRERHLKSEYVFTYRAGEHRLKASGPGRGRKVPPPTAKRVTDIKNGFKAALKRAGITDCRFHDLRHTFASHLVMRGRSLKEIQELLGHKDIKMTMRYAHLSEEHKRHAVNTLNGLTGEATCHKTVTNSVCAL
jgi:integrase